jgi:hypothetical protein
MAVIVAEIPVSVVVPVMVVITASAVAVPVAVEEALAVVCGGSQRAPS